MIDIRPHSLEDGIVTLPPEMANLKKEFSGSIYSQSSEELLIKRNILRLLSDRPKSLTLAQQTNYWSLTADNYEDSWRKNALGMMTGEEFPLEREKKLLVEWMNFDDGLRVLDIGCSTALYARTAKEANPTMEVVAIDFAVPMLEAARNRILEEDLSVYLVQANAEHLPFKAAYFDRLLCGGTLNEFADPLKALYESRRVIRKEGLFFVMYLLKAESWYGRGAQVLMEAGGIQFWTEEESKNLFQRAGFSVERFQKNQIVAFALLRAN